MERDEVGTMLKKQRTGDLPNSNGEGCSMIPETQSEAKFFVEDTFYKLYYKGVVHEETTVATDGGKKMAIGGVGVAICDQMDQLLFELKEPVNEPKIDQERVGMRALIRGLSESLDLGIRKIVICCGDYDVFKNISGHCNPEENQVTKILVENIKRLREKFASSEATLVAQKDIKFACQLAREAIIFQTSSAKVIQKKRGEICVICLEETKPDDMFVNDKCFHRHCASCVYQFVLVKLRDGNVPTCLDDGCKVELTLESCMEILTPKVIKMWNDKMKEDSIPPAERIYCPYQNCSTLMSKSDFVKSDPSNVGECVKCSGRFCIECKVPMHSELSCAEYKKLHPEPLVDDFKLKSLAKDKEWRQCAKCQHLIELNTGCNHMTCRCGHHFCYKCGVEWKQGQIDCRTGCLGINNEEGDGEDDDEDDDDPYPDLYADGGLSDSSPILDFVDYYTF